MNASRMIGVIMPFALMIAIFYIMVLIPEKKRKKKYTSMLDGLRINDDIMTRGGIIGKIVKIHDDFVIMETGPDKLKMKLSKNGIALLLNKDIETEK